MRRTTIALAASLLTTSLVATVATNANASGFSTARFGFEHGHPTTDNATSIYYNPAGLGLKPGIEIMGDGAIAYRLSSYNKAAAPTDSPEIDGTPPANTGESSLTNIAAAPMLGFRAGIPLTDDITLGLGAGAFVPFGGAASWSRNDAWDGRTEAAGPLDGSQRWYSIHGSLRSIYISGGASLSISNLVHFGISGGVSLDSIDTIRARNADGSNNLQTEGRAWAKFSKTHAQLGGGVMITPLDGKLRIGLSYQAPPGFADQRLEGTLVTQLGGSIGGRDTLLEVTHPLPDIFRIGISYRFADVELRAFGDLQRWSLFDNQCFSAAGTPCEVEDNGADKPGTTSLANLPRRWKDAGGVRVGASYWALPTLELMGGLGYDSSAIPSKNLDPALTDFHDISVAAGVNIEPIPELGIMLGYTHLFYISRDTNGESDNPRFQGQSTGPDAGGEYSQTIGVFHVNLKASFDPFTEDPEPEAAPPKDQP